MVMQLTVAVLVLAGVGLAIALYTLKTLVQQYAVMNTAALTMTEPASAWNASTVPLHVWPSGISFAQGSRTPTAYMTTTHVV